jgi:hypothetical protein
MKLIFCVCRTLNKLEGNKLSDLRSRAQSGALILLNIGVLQTPEKFDIAVFEDINSPLYI